MATDRKAVVQERYGAVAGRRTGCCGSPIEAEPTSTCGSGCCATSSAENTAVQLGYTVEELAAIPESANLGLGCGNPTAIAALQPGETVLDLGSGAGIDCFLAAGRVGRQGRVIGVDFTPEMLERAWENQTQGDFPQVEFRQGDIETLPVESDSVDVVLSNCVLNLVPDKAKAFAEIHRVLKPGGRMCVSDIVLERPLPDEIRDDVAAYAACISGALLREEYLRLLGTAGLTSIHVERETDAGGLLAECPGPVSDFLRHGWGEERLAGWVTSLHLTARKPGRAA